MKLICSTLSALLIFGSLPAALAVAPATAKIAFTSNREGNSEIYIMNPDGSEQVNLTRHRALIMIPSGPRQVSKFYLSLIDME